MKGADFPTLSLNERDRRWAEVRRLLALRGMGGRENRDLVLREGMSFAFEPNACKGQRRVNVGGSVVVTKDRPGELNKLANRMCRVG